MDGSQLRRNKVIMPLTIHQFIGFPFPDKGTIRVWALEAH